MKMFGARLWGRTGLCLALGLAVLWPNTASAQIVTPTREEIQRQQLDERLRTRNVDVVTDGGVERAPCPLADPQFSDIRFTFREAQFSGLDSIDAGIVAPAYIPYVGQDLPIAAVCEIRDRAATLLRQAGYLASVQVPAQEIDSGVVRFDAVLARLVAVQVRGDAGRSDAALRRHLDQLTGQDVFNTSAVERQLLLARDIPGLDVRLTLRPAPAELNPRPGDVVGVVDVSNTPVMADLTVQNYGSKQVGRFGGLARVTLNGITGLADQTVVSFFNTADFSEQSVAQVAHEFGAGPDGLRIGADFTYAWTKPDLVGPDPFESETLVAGIHASYPLQRTQDSTLLVTGGFEHIDQEVEFNGLPLSEDTLNVAFIRFDLRKIDGASVRGRAGYSPSEPRWSLSAAIEARQGLDLFGTSEGCGPALVRCAGANPAVPVPPARLDGDPTAFVIRGQAEMQFRPTPDWTFSLRPRFQYSPDALFSYEEISGGNYTIGRGFDPGAAIGDSGLGTQIEVAYGSPIPETRGEASYQPYVFYDTLAIWNENVAGDPEWLHSIGAGVRGTIGPLGFIDATLAVPLNRSVFQANRGDVRFLINWNFLLAPR